MVIIVVILYVVSGVLPLVGLTLLVLASRRSVKEAEVTQEANQAGPMIAVGDGPNMRMVPIGSMADASVDNERRPFIAFRQVLRDLGLIGGGVVAGVIASIWSLFL